MLSRPALAPSLGHGTNADVCTIGVDDYDADLTEGCETKTERNLCRSGPEGFAFGESPARS